MVYDGQNSVSAATNIAHSTMTYMILKNWISKTLSLFHIFIGHFFPFNFSFYFKQSNVRAWNHKKKKKWSEYIYIPVINTVKCVRQPRPIGPQRVVEGAFHKAPMAPETNSLSFWLAYWTTILYVYRKRENKLLNRMSGYSTTRRGKWLLNIRFCKHVQTILCVYNYRIISISLRPCNLLVRIRKLNCVLSVWIILFLHWGLETIQSK